MREMLIAESTRECWCHWLGVVRTKLASSQIPKAFCCLVAFWTRFNTILRAACWFGSFESGHHQKSSIGCRRAELSTLTCKTRRPYMHRSSWLDWEEPTSTCFMLGWVWSGILAVSFMISDWQGRCFVTWNRGRMKTLIDIGKLKYARQVEPSAASYTINSQCGYLCE